MPNDPLIRDNFGLLPEPKGRWRSFGVAALTDVAIILLLVLLALNKHTVKKISYIETLIVPTQTPPPKPPVKIPPVKFKAPPQPQVARLEPPKIVMPKPLPEPPKPVQLKTAEPKLPPPPPKRVAPPPQPKVGLFSSPKPTEVANNRTHPTVQTGGFGDPLGARKNALSKQSQMVAVGSFNDATGERAKGAGAARKGAITGTSFGSGVAHGVPGGRSHGTVASAGFSNGVVGGSGRGPTGKVQTAGFTSNVGKAPTQVAIRQTTPAFVPPVVLSEPHPKYTAEAIKMRIQGEVTLKVRFMASGQVEVLQVISGLGHGLDEEARQVAEHIRFKPAEKDGRPVDHTTLIHVTFQLA